MVRQKRDQAGKLNIVWMLCALLWRVETLVVAPQVVLEFMVILEYLPITINNNKTRKHVLSVVIK